MMKLSLNTGLPKMHFAAAGICTLALLTGFAPAQSERGETVELTIEVSGIEAPTGAVAIAVFDDPEGYEARENPVARSRLPAAGDSVAWKVTLPADRRYAVLAYHDVNANGEIDIGRFGIPREPYGFSNAARSPIGPPRFAAAAFELTAGAAAIQVRIR